MKNFGQYPAFALLIFLILAGLFGVKPSNFNDALQIGPYKLSPFLYGFSIYQSDTPYFYRLSPYNDYTVDQSGSYSAIVTKEEIVTNQYAFSTGYTPLQTKIQYFLNLFNLSRPRVIFTKGPTTIKYSARINRQQLTINQQMSNLAHTQNAVKSGLTLSYNCFNFIFDNNHQLYTDQTPADMAVFQQINRFPLQPHVIASENINDWILLPTSSIYIFNSRLPGLINLVAQEDQQIYLNPTYCLLSVQKPHKPGQAQFTNSLTLNLFNSFHDLGL